MHLGMERPEPAFVSLSARPPRSVIFVPDLPKIRWETMWSVALSAQSTVWGGSGNLVVPLYDGVEREELLWALLDLFDPDFCFVFSGTTADLEELDPAAFAAWQTAAESQLAAFDSVERQRALEHELEVGLDDWQLPETLSRQLAFRSAVFAEPGGKAQVRGPWGTRPPWPLVSVLDLDPRLSDVIEPALIADPVHRLLATAEMGRLPRRVRNAFNGPQSNVTTINPASRLDLIRWVYGRQAPGGVSPFDVTQTGCAWFLSGYRDAPLTVVVTGDDKWDFALAYALRRARGWAFWLPAVIGWSATEREFAIREIQQVASRTGSGIAVTSTSNEDAAEQLSDAFTTRSPKEAEIRHVAWRRTLPRHANRLLTYESLGLESAMVLEEGRTQDVATPIPVAAQTAKPEDLRWVTELTARGWATMRHGALVNGPFFDGSGDSRPTRRGVAYSCPNWYVQYGVPLIHQVRRPRFAPLAPLEQVRLGASDNGWDCQLSHKGAFSLAACSLFGGFEQLCAELRNEDIAKLLMAYLDGGREAPGLALAQRRYLRLADVAELALSGVAGDLATRLDGMQVLVRGLVLKCERCRYTTFYRPREFDPRFSCTRCSHEQKPGPPHWLGSAEPEWHYRLDEAVFQFLRQHGDIPMLAAYDLFRNRPEPVQVIPEVEFLPKIVQELKPDPDAEPSRKTVNPREVDFVVLGDGAVSIGEGFTGDRYAPTAKAENKRLDYLSQIAQAVNAQTVILATSASNLNTRTTEAAERKFRLIPGPRLVMRTAVAVPERPRELIDQPVE
jgi:hypothetical protein